MLAPISRNQHRARQSVYNLAIASGVGTAALRDSCGIRRLKAAINSSSTPLAALTVISPAGVGLIAVWLLYGVDRSFPSRPSATVRDPYSNRMSLCARMLARLSTATTNVVARECRVGPNRSRPTMRCRHDRRTTNRLNINEFSRSTNTLPAVGRRCSRANQVAGAVRDDRRGCARQGDHDPERAGHHGRADVGVAQQLLHGPNVVAILKQLCRERMPECVWTHTFGDAGLSCRARHGLLDNGFVEVKAGRWSPSRIGTDASSRKRELPPPLRGCTWVLAVEREG